MSPPHSSTILAVSAERLGRRFGAHWAVAHVALDVQAGETVLIAGANGSGKTTLLRLIAGLLRPSRGRLTVFGHSPHEQPAQVRRRLTLISHHAYLYDGLTALEMLELWNRLTDRPCQRGELFELLATVGLEDRRDHLVGGFSAGMRKRLTLLRTSLERPDLILLDEPFAALDPAGREMIEQWLESFRQQGKTVIMASHSMERATRVCRRALFLESGQVVWRGLASELAGGFRASS